jgi:hypothetical protein
VGGTRERRVHRVHHTTAPRAPFEVGIRDAARQALMVLCHQESAVLRCTQHRHFLLKEADGSEVHLNDKVHNDPTRRLGEQVWLTMAMDRALTKAMHEIVELHRCFDEQERVIKDRDDDLIAELMAEDSEDDNDSNSSLNYEGDDDKGAEEDLKEVLEGDAS